MSQETPYGSLNDIDHPPRRPRLALWIAIAAVIALALLVWIRHRSATPAPTGGRFGNGGPLTVGVAKVTTGDVPITINALGTVTPLATVTIKPQVSGNLVKIAFNEGQLVKAGDVLAEVDPRPYQAVYDQAEGALKRDQALLANAKIDLDRYKTLLAQNSISEQQYATQVATVGQDEATIATDQASVESAKLNLEFCHITSPVNGRVGLRQVDIGNLMQADSTEIVVVTQMQPMSVVFTVPEDNVDDILQRLNQGAKLSIDAYDRSVSNKIASGVLSNADNEIDTTTGTLKLRSMYDNKDLRLFPSQFVNVKLLLDTLHNQTVVPGAAVQTGSQGSYVYVVDTSTNTVSMRTITTGPSAGDQVSITKGLSPGEVVVVDGADQLRDGARVTLPSNAPKSAAGGTHRRRGQGGPGTPGQGEWRRRQGGSSGGSYPGAGDPGRSPGGTGGPGQ